MYISVIFCIYINIYKYLNLLINIYIHIYIYIHFYTNIYIYIHKESRNCHEIVKGNVNKLSWTLKQIFFEYFLPSKMGRVVLAVRGGAGGKPIFDPKSV